jgi:hypothetical protein
MSSRKKATSAVKNPWDVWRQEHWSPLLEFAENHYVLGDDAPVPGLFNIWNSPYLAEPFKAWCDPSISEITMQLAAQLGKNMMTEIVMSYIPLHMPGNVLFYAQTDEDAEEFMEKRALPRMRSIQVLEHLMPSENVKGHRQASRDCSIILPHMWMMPLGVNDSNTRGKSAPYVLNDELHIQNRWTKGMRSKCKERTSAFWDSKVLNTSTAGDEGSEIDLAFLDGSMEMWTLACPECKQLVNMRWNKKPRMISWEPVDGEEGWNRMYPEKKKWNFQEVRKNIRFICPNPKCGCQHRDSTELRREMNRLAQYVVTNPNAPEDHRSFQANQLAAWWKSYEEIVERWIKATELQKTGDTKELRLFIIEALGETWNFQITPGTQVNLSGGYSIADTFKWDEEFTRFMTVDVQEKGSRHMWVVIRAWAQDGVSRLVWAGRCNSWTEVKDIRKLYEVNPGHVAVDCRYVMKEVQEVCGLNGWIWLMADGGKHKDFVHEGPGGTRVTKPFSPPKFPDVFRGTKRQGTLFPKGFHFSEDWAVEALHNRIIGQGTRWELPHDIETLKFPGTYTKECSYMEQLQSWVRAEETDKKTNEVVQFWKQIFKDDHIHADEEMQLVMAALKGIVPLDVELS